jgi:LuxR family maltose regulon positive regulatory protein
MGDAPTEHDAPGKRLRTAGQDLSYVRDAAAADGPREADGACRDIEAALARDDWRSAIAAAYASWGPLVSYRPDALERLAGALPPAAAEARPEWTVLRAYLRQQRVPADLRPVVYRDDGPAPATDATPATRTVLLTSRATAARTAGRFYQACTLATRAEAAARREARPSAPLRALFPALLVQWALAHEFAGDPGSAAVLLREAYERAGETGNPRAQANAAGELGWLLALAGDREADAWLDRWDALRSRDPRVEGVTGSGLLGRSVRLWDDLHLHRARREAESIDLRLTGEHLLLAAGVRVLVGSRLAQDRGTALLSQFDTWFAATPREHAAVGFPGQLGGIVRADVLTLQGEAAAALRMFQRMEAGDGPWIAARRAVAHLLVDEDDHAEEAARAVLADARGTPRSRIEAELVLATTARRRGDRTEAAARFSTAVAAATAHGTRMPLALVPRAELEELVGLVGRERAPEWLSRVRADAVVAPGGQRLIRLTRQEERLLCALSEDADEQALAVALEVSRNTVRTQLHTLYRKFGVNSRGALRAHARRQGLL